MSAERDPYRSSRLRGSGGPTAAQETQTFRQDPGRVVSSAQINSQSAECWGSRQILQSWRTGTGTGEESESHRVDPRWRHHPFNNHPSTTVTSSSCFNFFIVYIFYFFLNTPTDHHQCKCVGVSPAAHFSVFLYYLSLCSNLTRPKFHITRSAHVQIIPVSQNLRLKTTLNRLFFPTIGPVWGDVPNMFISPLPIRRKSVYREGGLKGGGSKTASDSEGNWGEMSRANGNVDFKGSN